jgi:hypothetical protein
MTKLLTVDGIEIEFEKQNTDHACKWCIYLRLKKKDKEQTFLMIRTNEKPFTRFTYNSGKTVTLSEEVVSEILTNSVNITGILDEMISDHEKGKNETKN